MYVPFDMGGGGSALYFQLGKISQKGVYKDWQMEGGGESALQIHFFFFLLFFIGKQKQK